MTETKSGNLEDICKRCKHPRHRHIVVGPKSTGGISTTQCIVRIDGVACRCEEFLEDGEKS